MIVRVLPTQVSDKWDLIKTGIINWGAGLFPGNWNLANNLFQKALAGLVQVWLAFDTEGENLVIKGFVLTAIDTGRLDGSRVLDVLAAYALKQPSKELLREGSEALLAFAKANSCSDITIVSKPGHRTALIEDLFNNVVKQVTLTIPVR